MSIISALQEIFSLKFMVYALISGTLVSVCASLLGVTLVLKRYSMIGDGLSHVAFGSLAVAAAVGAAPMKVAIPVVIAAAFLLLRLSEKGKLKGDALTALISTGALAVGIMAISLSSGMNIDIYNYMFGSILAMSAEDVYLSLALAAVVLLLFVVFYNRIFAITFDESFARATGTRVSRYNLLIALLTALTIVIGMRIMGTMLISGLIIFPALTAMRVCRSFRGVVLTSAIISVFSFLAGMVLSYVMRTPAGASIVAVNALLFCLFALIGKLAKR